MAGIAPGVPRALAGRYRLVRLLARGGMAEVWEGRDDILSRPVAVKMLLPHLAADPNLRERFRREAVTAARLVHPGIVAIFDAGVEAIGEEATADGGALSPGESAGSEVTWPERPRTAFIIMELVPGETLRDLMARSGPMPVALAIAIASQVADALAHAHAHGLVHRDIKPANVLLRDEGGDMARVKVADFGIARVVATTGDLTANGTFMGTPKYVSPEQVEGREPDPRADLYSLGVVLFEMLAGRPPFQESTDMATALAHVQKAPPRLEQLRSELPAGLADVVASLLAKDPERRMPSALALCGSLSSVRKRMGAPASEPGANLYLAPGPVAPSPPGRPAEANRERQAAAAVAVEPAPVGPAPTETLPAASPNAAARLPSRGLRARLARRSKGRAVADKAGGHRTGRTTAAIVLSLLAAGSLVALVLFDGHPGAPARSRAGGDKTARGTASTSLSLPNNYAPIKVLAVREVAQGGNKPNDDLAGLSNIIGDNPGAYWQSDLYKSADFGGYGGLGLALQLQGTRTLHDLVVTTDMQDWSAEAFVNGSYAATASRWGQPVSRLLRVNNTGVFPLYGKRGAWVLLWMLNPGPTDRATVDKVSVR